MPATTLDDLVYRTPKNATGVPLGKIAIGTCSKCGGAVCIHSVWQSVGQDIPTCASCGAWPKGRYGPKMQME